MVNLKGSGLMDILEHLVITLAFAVVLNVWL